MIIHGCDVRDPGYYWVRRNTATPWSLLHVAVPERCHADCGLGAWEFIKIEEPKD